MQVGHGWTLIIRVLFIWHERQASPGVATRHARVRAPRKSVARSLRRPSRTSLRQDNFLLSGCFRGRVTRPDRWRRRRRLYGSRRRPASNSLAGSIVILRQISDRPRFPPVPAEHRRMIYEASGVPARTIRFYIHSRLARRSRQGRPKRELYGPRAARRRAEAGQLSGGPVESRVEGLGPSPTCRPQMRVLRCV